MIEVKLTWAECDLAALAGAKRRLLALHDRRGAAYGFKETDTWGSDIESCAAELAVARYLGLYWTAWARRPGDVKADVGEDVQVRRRGQPGWDLLLHEADHDEHRFVLVTGQMPDFALHGWIFGAEGKVPEFWGDPYSTGRPCFWVPQAALAPLDWVAR